VASHTTPTRGASAPIRLLTPHFPSFLLANSFEVMPSAYEDPPGDHSPQSPCRMSQTSQPKSQQADPHYPALLTDAPETHEVHARLLRHANTKNYLFTSVQGFRHTALLVASIRSAHHSCRFNCSIDSDRKLYVTRRIYTFSHDYHPLDLC